MGEVIESNNKLTVMIDDKYLMNTNMDHIDIYNGMDELFAAAIRYLRDTGKSCEFLGVNSFGKHVVLIDGVKYCTCGKGVYDLETLSYEVFIIVKNEDQDYVENFYGNRKNELSNILENKKVN